VPFGDALYFTLASACFYDNGEVAPNSGGKALLAVFLLGVIACRTAAAVSLARAAVAAALAIARGETRPPSWVVPVAVTAFVVPLALLALAGLLDSAERGNNFDYDEAVARWGYTEALAVLFLASFGVATAEPLVVTGGGKAVVAVYLVAIREPLVLMWIYYASVRAATAVLSAWRAAPMQEDARFDDVHSAIDKVQVSARWVNGINFFFFC
jgi:hypothetical protein